MPTQEEGTVLVEAEEATTGIHSEATVNVRSRIRYTSELPHVRGLSRSSQGNAHIGNGTRAASRSVCSRISNVLLTAWDAITSSRDAAGSVQLSDEANRPA